jgi:hypothetical protein
MRRQSSRHRIFTMSPTDEINDLRLRLRGLETEFVREMIARGFDPAQAENVALPSHLAELYTEREQIKVQLEELEGKSND